MPGSWSLEQGCGSEAEGSGSFLPLVTTAGGGGGRGHPLPLLLASWWELGGRLHGLEPANLFHDSEDMLPEELRSGQPEPPSATLKPHGRRQ